MEPTSLSVFGSITETFAESPSMMKMRPLAGSATMPSASGAAGIVALMARVFRSKATATPALPSSVKPWPVTGETPVPCVPPATGCTAPSTLPDKGSTTVRRSLCAT